MAALPDRLVLAYRQALQITGKTQADLESLYVKKIRLGVPFGSMNDRQKLAEVEGTVAFDPAVDLAAKLDVVVDWRDEGLITTPNAAVSQVIDSVSAAAFVQAVGANQPVHSSADGFDFDGTNDEFAVASVPMPQGADAWYYAALVRQDSLPADTNTRLNASWGGTGATTQARVGRQVVSGVSRANFALGNGTTIITLIDTQVDYSGWHVVEAWTTGTAMFLSVDGTPPISLAVVPSIGATRTRIGASSNNTVTLYWDGATKVHMWLAVLPTALERGRLVNYLRGLI